MTVIVAAEVNNCRRLMPGGMAIPSPSIHGGLASATFAVSATSPCGNHLVADDRLVEDASPHLDAEGRMG